MSNISPLVRGLCAAAIGWTAGTAPAATTDPLPRVPRFSVEYMDPSVPPGVDFYRYANGNWLKRNPVPPDKSRWGGFMELQERNWALLRQILNESTGAEFPPNSPGQKVRDFYRSAMDTNRIEALGFKPIAGDLKAIESIGSPDDLLRLTADFHARGIGAFFGRAASPDARDSGVYAFYLSQGGLGLPDRDYYLEPKFAAQREAYEKHIGRMLELLGDSEAASRKAAATVLTIETALAQASKSRADLRDPIANYHKFSVQEVMAAYPDLSVKTYLEASGLRDLKELVIRQPEFFQALYGLVLERPMTDWKNYLRWHLVRSTAPLLHAEAENEAFAFYGKVLRDQQAQEPRWQRSARTIDAGIGEALGQMYVERHFPPEARARMAELVANLKAVFADRLKELDWMGDATRAKALAKFERFTEKIGHPEKFRDYSAVTVRPDDYLGNVQRAEAFESGRRLARVGRPVDRSEWHMTPQTVNAYFNPFQNEIVFPAGILQPPFFDLAMDDAVNYGAIGVVIGHEITHGYDDQGRKFDAEGNLNEWWTAADAAAFDRRAQKVIAQYEAYEALPGLHLNGKLTLGENIADLGGTSIAYEALQRALAKDPAKRKKIDGFTPEQRFFLSLAQIWRMNTREAELRRLVTVDPHSPGQFRGFGPHVNLAEFFDAFGIRPGQPMWRDEEARAKIW